MKMAKKRTNAEILLSIEEKLNTVIERLTPKEHVDNLYASLDGGKRFFAIPKFELDDENLPLLDMMVAGIANDWAQKLVDTKDEIIFRRVVDDKTYESKGFMEPGWKISDDDEWLSFTVKLNENE